MARLADLLGSDTFGVRPTRREAWTKTEHGAVLTLPLPHATRDDLTLTRSGHDLALRIGGIQRNIPCRPLSSTRTSPPRGWTPAS